MTEKSSIDNDKKSSIEKSVDEKSSIEKSAIVKSNGISNGKPILFADNLWVAAKSSGTPILRGVCMQVNAGEIVGLAGESGCGKTTTAFALADLLHENLHITEGMVSGAKAGVIFQNPKNALNPLKRIGWQIEEKLRLERTQSESERKTAVRAILQEMSLPEDAAFLRKYPHELSGGQCQRVLLAAALIDSPDAIIADEPTSSLDEKSAAEILALICRIRKSRNCAVLFISHDEATVQSLCDRILFMHDGKIYDNPLSHSRIEPVDIALSHAEKNAHKKVSCGESVLVAQNVTAFYRNERQLLRTHAAQKSAAIGFAIAASSGGGIETGGESGTGNFTIYPGEIVGLSGVSGCGKTTLAKVFCGILPYSGSVKIGGREVSATKPPERKNLVQMIFQNPYMSLNPQKNGFSDFVRSAYTRRHPSHEKSCGIPNGKSCRKSRARLRVAYRYGVASYTKRAGCASP
ncbi:MAG: hypothetical protein Ta2A_20550 [Treponemataceae bacterium]|nr:MAG: hypothetical protein Ta2A_20550 [Treponemataceae bacterium]